MINSLGFDTTYQVQTPERVDYNEFFHPAVCHVCKLTKQKRLQACDMCGMISYCSEEHKSLHQPDHKDICEIIVLLKASNLRQYNRHLSFNKWIEVQKEYVMLAQTMLPRKLERYEVQMFMFAKSCYVCHERRYVFTCVKCLSVSYCANHIKSHYFHTTYTCDKMALSVALDTTFLDKKAWEALHVKFYAFPNKFKRVTDIRTFCNQYYRKIGEFKPWDLNKYSFSDYVSDALSLYNGLQSVNLFRPNKVTNTFIIHVICATDVEVRNFPAWELFLHLLSKKTKLIIAMVGSDLRQIETREHKVCSRCKAAQKRLILESWPVMYHIYTVNIKFTRPDVIVGFQAKFGNGDAWSELIKAIQAQKRPLLLTTTSLIEMNNNIIRIQKVLGKSIKPLFFNAKHEFASYRPYRDIYTKISFRNRRLVVFKNLNVSNDQANSGDHP